MSCSSQCPDHICMPGSSFDCYDINTPNGVRMPYKLVEELYKTWWMVRKFPIPLPGFPADWCRDLPLPIQNVTISFRNMSSLCITMWSFVANVFALLFVGAWLFLIFVPQSEAVWYSVLLFAVPVVLSVVLEVFAYNVVSGHKSS
jgi:hypothetical protein